jgi:hypothetical protein
VRRLRRRDGCYWEYTPQGIELGARRSIDRERAARAQPRSMSRPAPTESFEAPPKGPQRAVCARSLRDTAVARKDAPNGRFPAKAGRKTTFMVTAVHTYQAIRRRGTLHKDADTKAAPRGKHPARARGAPVFREAGAALFDEPLLLKLGPSALAVDTVGGISTNLRLRSAARGLSRRPSANRHQSHTRLPHRLEPHARLDFEFSR